MKIIILMLLTFIANQCLAMTKVHISIPQSQDTGSIYVDGIYTGEKTPATLTLSQGQHVIGVGLDQQRIYYRKTIELSDKAIKVQLDDSHKASNQWKALFVGVPTVVGFKRGSHQTCTSQFSQLELDQAFEFFKFNLKQQIEPYSYNTVNWQIERHDLTQPVRLHYNPENDWYTLEAQQGLAELDNVQAGNYDNVFLFWREQQADCSFKSSYFGLAWLEPTSKEARQTGYVTVKFNPGEIGVAKTLARYKQNDPGVWTHEWLHVVIEKFYPDRKVKTPIPPQDALILHAAQAYGYQYPWMQWYKDLISGQVRFGQTYRGIGPEALLNCSIIKAVEGGC